MAKQDGDISIVIAPSNDHGSQATDNVHPEENLEKQWSIPSVQPGVYRADALRKSWTKQGLIIVFTGYVGADSLQDERLANGWSDCFCAHWLSTSPIIPLKCMWRTQRVTSSSILR